MNPSYLLILGAPRSGTTLTAAMLGCHSKIAVLNENLDGSVQRILSKQVRGVKLCVPNQIELSRRNSFVTKPALGLFRQVGIRSLIPWPSSRWSIRDYQKRTPNLRIVAVIRDVRDVIASIRRRGNQPTRVAEYRWSRAVEVLSTLYAESPKHLIIVLYSRLVASPNATMKNILEELDLDFEEDVLEGYRHTPQYTGNQSIRAEKAREVAGDVPIGLADTPLLDGRPDLKRRFEAMLEAAL